MTNVISRIKRDLPDAEQIKDVVSRVQRELPDTDRDRYDIAYERGRAQARSGFVVGGIVLGGLVGAALMWLLDPARGAGRRADLVQRLGGLRNDVTRRASGRAEDIQNRLEGFAIERGIRQPPDADGRAAGSSGSSSGDYGQGYREGFGQTEYDPDAPGAQVDAPLQPAEVARYGPSGPVAGAGASVGDRER